MMENIYLISKLEKKSVDDANYSINLHGYTYTVLNADTDSHVVRIIEKRTNMLLPTKQLDIRTFLCMDYMVYNSISRNENVAGWKCDCKGYLFRKACKHIHQIKKKFDF